MKTITFITGNQKKADYLAEYLGFPIDHVKLDLDEIQSLDLREIVEHKARQAYEKLKKPVLVDDVALEFEALGRLPGPFIKFFLGEMTPETLVSLLEGKSRNAIARSNLGYFDGEVLKMFEGSMKGKIALVPKGEGGFGWDRIFIPEGHTVTRAELSKEEYKKVYLKIRPLEEVKEFLTEKLV